jgi:hypothetical protein
MPRPPVVILLAALLVATLAAPAFARSPRVVDPDSVTPPLNPNFAPWTCFDTGNGPICQGILDDEYAGEEIDMSCDGDPVYVSGRQRERMTRWHLPDGRATKTFVNIHFDEVLSLSPTNDGPTVRVKSRWNRHYDYLVPGDRDARVLTETGLEYLATAPGHGVVFKDVGLLRWTPGNEFDEIDVVRGPHDLLTDFEAVEAAVCAALR